jgi:long-subunit acyl-CoA synthetase (AMP-forming)
LGAFLNRLRNLEPEVIFGLEATTVRPRGESGVKVSPDTLASILFTSGSTGLPKGVIDNHRNVLHHIMRVTNEFHVCAEDR